MKTYIKPVMEITEVKAMNSLLLVSGPVDKVPEGGEDNQFAKPVNFADEETVW